MGFHWFAKRLSLGIEISTDLVPVGHVQMFTQMCTKRIHLVFTNYS